MRPARIVAVTRLILDVIKDLGTGPDADMCQSERLFFARLYVQAEGFQAIHDEALRDMKDLAHATDGL